MKLSIVIPAYNEENTLEELVLRVISVNLPAEFEKEIVIVDDGSKDNTWQIMQSLAQKYPEILIAQNTVNSGKSQTVRNGLLKTSGDYVIIQDADLEYEPSEITELLDLALRNNLDVVYGNRFGKKNKVIYWQNYFANKALSALSNFFTYPKIKTWIADMEVCYKLVRGNVIRDIAQNLISKSTFGLEPEITAKLAKYKLNGKHLKFGVVPISYYPRTFEEGKKMGGFKDGWKAFKEIVFFNIRG